MHEEMVARSHGLHVRAVRTDAREATFIASTDAIDSYDEIVEQSWRLERFVSNPVILYAHQSRELPIGTASDVKVVGGQLECTIRFLTEDKNPRAEQVWRMVRDGELRAVSVGFVPHTYRWEKRADREVLVLGDNELLEISVVPIPANPEALAKARAKAIAEAKENRDHVAATAAEEKSMEIEQLKALVAERDAALSEAQEKLAAGGRDAAEAKAAAEAREAALVTERDAALERAAAAEAKLVEAEVEALVGLKILPAEKEAMTTLAKKDRASFDALVRARPELKLLTQAVPTPTKASAPSPFADPSEELAARAERASE